MHRFDVIIAGELNLDLILYGLPEQLQPERELLASDSMLTLGSSSAIVAHNLAALGSKVGFISRIGDDPLGQMALERLAAGGVDVSSVRRTNAKTGLTVILQRDRWRNILTYPGTIFDLRADDLDFEYLSTARHFHLSSYFLQRGLRASVPELLRRLKSAGMTTSLDPNDDPDDEWQGLEQVLPYVDVILPNERETKRIAHTDDIDDAVAWLSQRVPLVVVKLGPQGAIAYRGSERFVSAPLHIQVIDPVGAGDSFDAGFLHEYLRSGDVESALALGNVAGAFSTTRPGGTEAFRDREYQQRFFSDARSVRTV